MRLPTSYMECPRPIESLGPIWGNVDIVLGGHRSQEALVDLVFIIYRTPRQPYGNTPTSNTATIITTTNTTKANKRNPMNPMPE